MRLNLSRDHEGVGPAPWWGPRPSTRFEGRIRFSIRREPIQSTHSGGFDAANVVDPPGLIPTRNSRERFVNLQRLTVVVASVAVVVTGAAWWVLPAMQPAERRVESQAEVHIERARRLLDRFNADLAYRSLLVDQLRDYDVDVDASDPAAMVDSIGDAYQAEHEELWKTFEPKEWQEGVGRPARASYGNLAGQIREGVGSRKTLIDENQRSLVDALAEADAALAVNVGEASGRVIAEAHRIKATILYHRGLAERVNGSLKRRDAEPILHQLVDLGAKANSLRLTESIVADSGVDERIKGVREKLSAAESRIAEARTSLSQLNATIQDLERKWSSARSRSDAARAEIDRLRVAGVDFSDPQGAENYALQLTQQDAAYRAAEREAHDLEVGALPNARIDASGDFLRGRYFEGDQGNDLTVSHGLAHYREERSILSMRVESEQAGAEGMKADLSRLEALKNSLTEQQADAVTRLAEIKSEAATEFDELNRTQSEAEAVEENALRLLDQSASEAQQAASMADQWVSDSRELAQGVSPEAKERSAFNQRSDDAWLGGFDSAQVADAREAMAWVFYDRFDAATRMAEALAIVSASIQLPEADVSAVRVKADDARVAGIKEIEMAMSVLEKAHRNVERHWTLTAQGAGITYLMVLFGQTDYLADAIEAYRAAVKGRENEAYAARIVSRLQRLENR